MTTQWRSVAGRGSVVAAVAVGAVVLAAIPATIARAAVPGDCSTRWIGESGGDFANVANWDSGVPDANDRACGDVSGMLVLSGSHTIGAWDGVGSDNVLRVVGGATLTVVEDLYDGNTSLELDGGNAIVGGAVSVESTTLTGASRLTLNAISGGEGEYASLNETVLAEGSTLDIAEGGRARSSDVTWTDGTVEGGGTWETGSDAVLSGPAAKIVGDQTTWWIEHMGAEWSGGDILLGDGAELDTEASLDILADDLTIKALHDTNDVAPLIRNTGEIYKDGGLGVATIEVAIDSSERHFDPGFGDIRVDSGELAVLGGLMATDDGIAVDVQLWNGGVLTIDDSTTLDVIAPGSTWELHSDWGAGMLADAAGGNPWAALAEIGGSLSLGTNTSMEIGGSSLLVSGGLRLRDASITFAGDEPELVLRGGSGFNPGVDFVGGGFIDADVRVETGGTGVGVYGGGVAAIGGGLTVIDGSVDLSDDGELHIGGALQMSASESAGDYQPYLGSGASDELGTGVIDVAGDVDLDQVWIEAYSWSTWAPQDGDVHHVVEAGGTTTATFASETIWPDEEIEEFDWVGRAGGVFLVIGDERPASGAGGEPHGTSVGPGGTVSSDPAGTLPTPTSPLVLAVTTPVAGSISITETTGGNVPEGYVALPVGAIIEAPDTDDPTSPLLATFTIDASVLDDGADPMSITVFRDGVAAERCVGSGARPDPCIASVAIVGGDIIVTVRTTHASTWTTGVSQVSRHAGSDRIATALELSMAEFGDDMAGAVVLARSDHFADALAGTPLAVAEEAPLLLTDTVELSDAVLAEIDRVLDVGDTVYLLGGTAALSPDVAAALADAGFRVERVAGADRFSTAVAVAEELGGPDDVVLATGRSFADSLTAGVLAAARGAAVLLTDDDDLPAVTAGYLATHDGEHIAVGGPASRAVPGATVVAGTDRYATAAAAAGYFADVEVVGVASGASFADALAAGPQLARIGAPLLLTIPGSLPEATADAAEGATYVRVYGGTAAVTVDVLDALADVLMR